MFSWLQNLIGLLTLSWLPPARRRKAIYWIVHVVLVVLVIVFLGWLNLQGGLDRVLRTRRLNLNLVWLPLLFLLAYLLFWLIRWTFRVLGAEEAAGEFDDVEQAWSEARRALDEAGISIQEVPVYLVIGKTSGSLEDAFAAARMPLLVRGVPLGDGPLHLFANREAAFVTCEGASLLSVHLDRLRESAKVVQPSTDSTPLGEYLASSETVEQPSAEAEATSQPIPRGAVMLLGEPEPQPGQTVRPQRESLLTDRDAVELATKRLQHVCNLLVRDRKPYCPINGIVVLLPLLVTDTAEDAGETAQIIRHDLETARGRLQMDCPRVVVLGDAERIPGFAEVVHHFPQGGDGPNWVLGQHFPLIPDVSADKVSDVIEFGVAWVGDAMLPLVVGQLWRREGEEGVSDRTAAIASNVHLYEFLHVCRQRLVLLGRLAARAVQAEGRPPYLAGCYLAGTGSDAEHEQGFLAGVLRRCLEQQNHVRWTADALADDRAYQRYALIGYALLVIFIVVIALTLLAWW